MTGTGTRKNIRHTSIYYLKTFDIDADAPLGRVVDINTTGLRLTGSQTIPEGLRFNVRVELPRTIRERDSIELQIVSVWTKTAVNQDLHETGFKIEKLDVESQRIIEVLDEEYVFAE